jgi:hypothetical protein
VSVTAVNPDHITLIDSRNDDQDRVRRIEQARRDCSICGKCGRSLGVSEHVWLRQLFARWYMGGEAHQPYTPTCAICAGPDRENRYHFRAPRPCATCERPVSYPSTARIWRWAFCSERCKWTRRNCHRSQRLAAARIRTCSVCGERFEPSRSDAAACSPACRQKAYRQRRRAR